MHLIAIRWTILHKVPLMLAGFAHSVWTGRLPIL